MSADEQKIYETSAESRLRKAAQSKTNLAKAITNNTSTPLTEDQILNYLPRHKNYQGDIVASFEDAYAPCEEAPRNLSGFKIESCLIFYHFYKTRSTISIRNIIDKNDSCVEFIDFYNSYIVYDLRGGRKSALLSVSPASCRAVAEVYKRNGQEKPWRYCIDDDLKRNPDAIATCGAGAPLGSDALRAAWAKAADQCAATNGAELIGNIRDLQYKTFDREDVLISCDTVLDIAQRVGAIAPADAARHRRSLAEMIGRRPPSDFEIDELYRAAFGRTYDCSVNGAETCNIHRPRKAVDRAAIQLGNDMAKLFADAFAEASSISKTPNLGPTVTEIHLGVRYVGNTKCRTLSPSSYSCVFVVTRTCAIAAQTRELSILYRPLICPKFLVPAIYEWSFSWDGDRIVAQ